jgi:predicted ribonuclease YlaK
MKSFVLDTTVLLHDPQALFAFGDNDVCVPISVIECIDRFKKDVNETGRNARQSSRLLDSIRSRGSLVNGVSLDNQIDNIYIDSSSNGLTYVVERFKQENISAHVTMKKGERSKLSGLAANLL